MAVSVPMARIRLNRPLAEAGLSRLRADPR
jgi:hypothetical protein